MITESEWLDRVERKAEKLLSGKRMVKLSPDLSTPEIANQFLEMAKKYGGVRLEVRINAPVWKLTKRGQKEGRKWVRYVKGENYSLKKAKA